MIPREAFALLGLTPEASKLDVRAAYIAKARSLHPDTGGDPAAFAELAEAHRVAAKHVGLAQEVCPACEGRGKVYVGKGWNKVGQSCMACNGVGWA